MNKNKKMFLITITFLMLLGLTTITATNIDTNDTTSTQTNTIDTTTQTNTINYDSTSTNEESTTPTDNIQKTTNSKETINNKTGSKTQNLKADTIVTSTYAELNSNLTSNAQDIVTIDIGDDIELEGNIVVNEAIKTLTINGNQKIINGMGQYRFLLIRNATTVIIDNIIITNCTTTANGGAIAGQKDSIITLQNSILTYNKANYGGAVHTDQGNIIITNTTLAYNNASYRGGAIHNNQGNLTINNSILTHNNANNLGGAIHSNKYLTIDFSNLTNNNATEGGAISLYGGNATTINTNITHNQALTHGGAIYNGNTDLTIINSNLKYNNASGGGAIHKNRGTTTIIDTNITHNHALIYGGAINNTRGVLTIINSSLNYNNATGGGAINNNGNITITNSNLNNNKVPQNIDLSRGGAILSDQGNIKINNSNLTNNYAMLNGGAIYFGHGILTIDSSNLTNNAARIHGGAVYNGYANLTINNSNLNYNNVTATGGAIHNNYGNVTLNDNTMEYNEAVLGGVILSNYGDVTISNNTMNYNSATEGGAIYNKLTNLTIVDSTLNFNNANKGGALNNLNGTMIVQDSTFNNNSANNTGGVIYSDTTNTYTVLKNSNITDNYVTSNDGYVVDFSNTNSVTITDNTFINNTDNNRDMLFSDAKEGAEVDIQGNTYIDNFLENTIIKPNVTVVTDNEIRSYDYDIDLVLRNIYYDTIHNGTLKVYVNGILRNTTNVTNGHAKIFFENSDLTKRENNITLEYINQSKHYQNTTTEFTVKKEINTTLSIQAPTSMTAGDTALINFTLTDVNGTLLSNETINVYVDEELVATLNTSRGVATYTFNASRGGTVIINATYHPGDDSIYLSARDVGAEIEVSKIKPVIEIGAGNIVPYMKSNITINLSDSDGVPIKNKTLTVNITGEGKPDITGTVTTDENGIGVFNFTPVDEGTLNVSVTSPGDDIYELNSTTVPVSVNFITTSLVITPTNTTINKTNTISVKVGPDSALLNGTVEFDINGEIRTMNITNGNGTYIDYSSETAGQKNITAKFTSDNPSYTNATTTSQFNVEKLPTRVTIEVINSTAGNVTLKVLVFPEEESTSVVDGGNLVIESVNGDNRTVIYNDTLENGELIYLTNINETGMYDFEAIYHGNNYFLEENNKTGPVEILPVNTNTTTFNKTALVGDTITLNATVTDENGNQVNDGNVTFLIDGTQLYHADGTPVEAVVENGIATTEYILPVTYTKGNHTITANYTGNNKYNTSSGIANLQIDPKETSIGGTPLNTTKANTTIEVTLNTTDDNKPIPNAEIIVKDKDNNTVGEGITDENGTTIITLDLPVGENNITITYPGNEIYAPQEEPMTINVTRRESKTTGTIVNNTVGNVTVDVFVVDAETLEPITGQVNLIVADEIVGTGNLSDDGRVSIPADINVKGNYTIIVEYVENDDYYGSSDTLDDVTVVGKVDMKVTAQNTSLNVILSDNQTAKPISDAPIIVTLPNGTNVTATTDENGTAVIPVDLEMGVNNLTVTYPGDDEYDSQEENITIIIKSYSTVTVDPVIGTVFDNVTFTANVVDYQGNLVNGGYVIFKVGGKTLTDENGNIKTYVVNGIAQLSYKAESGWIIDSHPNLKVQAVYSGTSIVSANRSDTSRVTIYKRNATVMVSAPSDYVNGTLHIDAVVRDHNGSLINDGVLVFKLNGLTLKDENNTSIIAKITNGTVHLDVKLPFAYSAKEYTLTAVYSNKIYNKATGFNTTSLKAIPTYINATVTIKDEYSKPVVTGQIYNKFNDAILEGTAVINIKFDGISYAKKVKVNNGTFNETLEGIPIYKPGTHKVEIVSGDTYHYQGVRKTYTTTATKKYDVNTEFINITRNKTTTRVQARMVDDKNKNVQRNLTITIKLNGKSFLVNKKITNGNVDVLIDTSKLSNRNYTLELVSGANTYYKASNAITELPKY